MNRILVVISVVIWINSNAQLFFNAGVGYPIRFDPQYLNSKSNLLINSVFVKHIFHLSPGISIEPMTSFNLVARPSICFGLNSNTEKRIIFLLNVGINGQFSSREDYFHEEFGRRIYLRIGNYFYSTMGILANPFRSKKNWLSLIINHSTERIEMGDRATGPLHTQYINSHVFIVNLCFGRRL